jgi:hypothetical protein
LSDAPKLPLRSSIDLGLWERKNVDAQRGRTEIRNVRSDFVFISPSPSSLETDSESSSTRSRALDNWKQSDVITTEFGSLHLGSKTYLDESVYAPLAREGRNL